MIMSRHIVPCANFRGVDHGKSLSDEDNERLRQVVRELLNSERFNGNQTRLGKELGKSQPWVSRFISGINGSSYQVALRVAELSGRPLNQILELDLTSSTVADGAVSRYPNAQAAAVFARSRGISEEAIEAVLTDQLMSDRDPSPDEWLQEMMRCELELRGKIKPVEVDWEAKKASSRPRWPIKLLAKLYPLQPPSLTILNT